MNVYRNGPSSAFVVLPLSIAAGCGPSDEQRPALAGRCLQVEWAAEAVERHPFFDAECEVFTFRFRHVCRWLDDADGEVEVRYVTTGTVGRLNDRSWRGTARVVPSIGWSDDQVVYECGISDISSWPRVRFCADWGSRLRRGLLSRCPRRPPTPDQW